MTMKIMALASLFAYDVELMAEHRAINTWFSKQSSVLFNTVQGMHIPTCVPHDIILKFINTLIKARNGKKKHVFSLTESVGENHSFLFPFYLKEGQGFNHDCIWDITKR